MRYFSNEAAFRALLSDCRIIYRAHPARNDDIVADELSNRVRIIMSKLRDIYDDADKYKRVVRKAKR